jgi:putative transposase
VRNVSLLMAIGVNDEGFREVLAVAEGAKEDKASWTAFLRHLKERGLAGVRLFVSDKCLGLVESLGEFYPEALWQRCTVHFYRNVWTAVPTSKVKEVAAMLKAVHAQEDRAAARQKAEQIAAKLKEMKLADAAALVLAGIEETLYYYAFPREHWRCLRTNNPLERLLREVRRIAWRKRVRPRERARKNFRLPLGEPSITTRLMLQQKCEKSWTLPLSESFAQRS